MEYEIKQGDCLDVMRGMPDASVDAVVTDPPYGLAFMGREWDHGIPGVLFWTEALRVAKPGAHLLAFGGTRTFHRLACAIEDAGWEIRDCIMWVYGCLSEDTEILVDGQWEPYHKAIAGRHALCYDVDHDEYQWQPIQDLYVYDYSDTAFRIVSDRTDQIVSRNHRCLVERGGRFVFRLAETLERQEKIPVLEGMPDLLCRLPVHHAGTGDTEPVLQSPVHTEEPRQSETSRGAQGENGYLCSLRKEVLAAGCVDSEGQGNVLFAAMQRAGAGRGLGEARSQRKSGMESTSRGQFPPQNERDREPCVEGWRDVLPKTRKLQADQVRQMPGEISVDGTDGRLRHGTSTDCSDGARAGVASVRGCASPEPRPTGQSAGEPGTVCQQSGPQAVRASRYTVADLARIEPIHYAGKVWCVRVPTGAFVARRNGKVFVTGNSGFPKSVDVSKAIDKAAGVEREVIGNKLALPGYHLNGHRGGEAFGHGLSSSTPETRLRSALVTAPATPEAARWQGWGTALKPAVEYIIVAQKPLNLRGICGTLALKLGGAICLLQSSVSTAESSSTSSPVEFGAEFDSALWDAALRCSTPGGLCALMDTSRSELAIPSSLSTALSWLDILGAILQAESTFTTETASSLITDLKILNSLSSQTIAAAITEAATGRRGTESSASLAVSIFTVVESKLASILTPSAPGLATSPGEDPGLRPDWRPVIVARKPLDGTVAANVLKHGTGAINVDGCRVDARDGYSENAVTQGINTARTSSAPAVVRRRFEPSASGRWPANLVHDGSDEVVALFPGNAQPKPERRGKRGGNGFGYFDDKKSADGNGVWPADPGGSAARFFKCCEQESKCPLCCLPCAEACDTLGAWKIALAITAEKNGWTSQATNEFIARVSAMRNQNEKLAQNVKSAGSLCDSCATSIAVALAGIKTSAFSNEELQVILGYIKSYENSILTQSLASFAELWGNTDTIPTTKSLSILFGYVRLATESYTKQGSDAKEDVGSDPEKETACRFKYSPKASKADRGERNNHPTVKPSALMRYLVRLVTPPQGTVLDPFAGSGSTGVAAIQEGFRFIGIEKEEEYVEIAQARCERASEGIESSNDKQVSIFDGGMT